MNRKNIDNSRFVDLDELFSMEIVPIQFVDDKEGVKTVKEGFRVDGFTKWGSRIESLFVDRQSNTPLACTNFIMSNWVNAKK